MFVIGLLIGAFVSLLTGLIPGINTLVYFVFMTLSAIEPFFALGFLVGNDSVSSLINVITNCIMPTDPVSQGYALFDKALIKKAILNTAALRMFILGLGIVLTYMGQTFIFKVNTFSLAIGFAIAFLMWAYLVKKNGIKGALVYFIVIAFSFACLRFQLNAIMFLTTALFGIPSLINSVSKKSKLVEYNPVITSEGISAGLFSTLLIGIPSNSLLAVVNQKGNKFNLEHDIISNCISSSIGLFMALTNTGARSAIANAINVINIDLTNPEIMLILLGSIIITGLVAKFAPLDFIINTSIKFIKPLKQLNLIALVGIVLFGTGIYGIPLILGGILINKIITNWKLDRALSLSGLSMIPVLGMMGVRF